METTNDYSDEVILNPSQFNILYLVLLFVSIIGIVFGAGIIAANIGIAIFNILEPPAFIAAWGLQGLISLVLGYAMFRIARAVKNTEMWAFSTALYLNIILIVLFITIGLVGLALAALSIISIILLFFLKDVKDYWYPNFQEDMGPRVKETKYSLYLLRRSPLVVGGVVVLVTFVCLALLAPVISPYGPEQRIWADDNLPPGSPSTVPDMPVHYWGTDDSGGDIFSRILYGAQVDLRISLMVVAVAVTVGTLIGAVAGYYGGKIDELVMRVTDVFFAFPGLVLAMAIVMALGERSMDNISVALMITWWPAYARLVRGQVLAEREKLYVEAARSVGASDMRILLAHVIPNTIQPIIVQATMDTGSVLLVAAGLAFIGFGPPAGIAEWGLMISIGQSYFMIAPWSVFFPGIAILVVALSFNLVGDGIRDIMDPKLRRR
ncbi:MAG: ABC transporter permease [Candidatus Thorarchaeota archaeon]|jgi:peptide/nickel transport system permease protein